MRAHLETPAHRLNPRPARSSPGSAGRSVPAALALCALLAAGLATVPASAHAGDGRVQWSVQIGLPVPVLPVPVPLPLRVEPRPAPARAYAPAYGPAYPHAHYPHAYPAPAWRDRDRDGVPDWRDPYDNRRPPVHRPGWRVDRDRDGIPDWRDGYDNRRDTRPLPPPAWHHRDRDHDGRPDWRERPGR